MKKLVLLLTLSVARLTLANGLELRISCKKVAIKAGEKPDISAHIINNGKKEVTLVQPGDGSRCKWRTPVVGWSVIPAQRAGRRHPKEPSLYLGGRCGNINALKPQEVFTLKPGQKAMLNKWIDVPTFPRAGTYRAVFYYFNIPDLRWRGLPLGPHDAEAMKRLKSSTRCSLVSNELLFEVGPAQSSTSAAGANDDDPSALHRAIASGQLARARELISRDPKRVNAEDKEGNYPLHWAARRGAADTARLLIHHGASVNASRKGWTPLHEAAYWGQFEVAKLLLENKADIEARSQARNTPLHTASGTGHIRVAKLLIDHGAKIDAEGYQKATPLYAAIQCGSKEIVELLLSKGANVSAKAFGTYSLLHKAASHGHKEIAEILLAHGADINAKGYLDRTPLFEATRFGHKEAARLLVAKGAECDIISAAFLADIGRVKALLKKNPKLATLRCKWSENNETALHWAARAGAAEIAALLLDHGADVNASDIMGRTPLHEAAFAGRPDAVQLLLRKGANVNAETRSGETPLDYAMDKGNKQVVDLIRHHGGKE